MLTMTSASFEPILTNVNRKQGIVGGLYYEVVCDKKQSFVIFEYFTFALVFSFGTIILLFLYLFASTSCKWECFPLIISYLQSLCWNFTKKEMSFTYSKDKQISPEVFFFCLWKDSKKKYSKFFEKMLVSSKN
jgi:hypothetical protein